MLKISSNPWRITLGAILCLSCALLLRVSSSRYALLKGLGDSKNVTAESSSIVNRLVSQDIANMTPTEIKKSLPKIKNKLSIMGWTGVACFFGVFFALLSFRPKNVGLMTTHRLSETRTHNFPRESTMEPTLNFVDFGIIAATFSAIVTLIPKTWTGILDRAATEFKSNRSRPVRQTLLRLTSAD